MHACKARHIWLAVCNTLASRTSGPLRTSLVLDPGSRRPSNAISEPSGQLFTAHNKDTFLFSSQAALPSTTCQRQLLLRWWHYGHDGDHRSGLGPLNGGQDARGGVRRARNHAGADNGEFPISRGSPRRDAHASRHAVRRAQPARTPARPFPATLRKK